MKPASPNDYIRSDDAVVSDALQDAHRDIEKVDRSKRSDGGYAMREKIYPRRATGLFRRVKWLVMIVTLGIYYLVPWLRWPRLSGQPDQAVLIDLGNQRLYVGPVEIWAQEFYFVSGLLILSALILFLVTSVAGRMWCGYACPQTVWTDLMIAIERFWQGDRAARIRLDKSPWTLGKVSKKFATHASWVLVGLVTGGAFVFYFRDAPTLAQELLTGTAPYEAYAFVVILTTTTYLLGGLARDQVCIYMCPWPRIQGAMLDSDSLLISYRSGRGEPRGPIHRGEDWSTRGDCIDCKACIAVCPMGIDIRDGSQLECIQCALCIDACDDVMGKIGRDKGLIAYATQKNVDNHDAHPREGWRLFRPRTMLYAAVISVISAIMVAGFVARSDLQFSVAADRNPLFVTLRDGSIRNGYVLHVVNKTNAPREFSVVVNGLGPNTRLMLIGAGERANQIEVGPADVLNLKAYLVVPAAVAASGVAPFRFVLEDLASGARFEEASVFHGPRS